MTPPDPAALICEENPVGGQRVILEGRAPGVVEIVAHTRKQEDNLIPCSPTPDGGWSFPDAGPDWPMHSTPLTVEVR